MPDNDESIIRDELGDCFSTEDYFQKAVEFNKELTTFFKFFLTINFSTIPIVIALIGFLKPENTQLKTAQLVLFGVGFLLILFLIPTSIIAILPNINPYNKRTKKYLVKKLNLNHWQSFLASILYYQAIILFLVGFILFFINN